MQDNKMDYVPANIVKMLFEQSQNSIDDNTLAIKEMTASLNELARVIQAPPTKQTLLDEIKEHEENCGNRNDKNAEAGKEFYNTRRLEDEKRHNSLIGGLGAIQSKINAVFGRVNLMILVVGIAFSLISITYIYVNNSVNTSVKSVLEEHVKTEKQAIIVHQEAQNATK